MKAFSIRKKERKNKKAARVTKKRQDADNEVSDSSSSDEGNHDEIPESYYKSNLNIDRKDSTAATMIQVTGNFGAQRKDPYEIEASQDSEESSSSFHNKNRQSSWMKEVIGTSS